MAKKQDKTIKVTLVKSTIGFDKHQAKVVEALGFTKLQSTVEHEDTPQIRGMIEHVRHLVVWTAEN